MLTIEEIKKELDAKSDLKIECFDFTGLVNNKYYSTSMCDLDENPVVKVKSVRVDAGIVNIIDARGVDIEIFTEQLQFFRIKRPTFDDLIDVAVQAYKDGVIFKLLIKEEGINFKAKCGDANWDADMDRSSAIGGIEDIKSLYTETFVIDDIESLQKVKIDANGVLANGSKFKVHRAHGQYSGKGKLYIEFESETTNHASLEVLKGATVTQKRGGV